MNRCAVCDSTDEYDTLNFLEPKIKNWFYRKCGEDKKTLELLCDRCYTIIEETVSEMYIGEEH